MKSKYFVKFLNSSAHMDVDLEIIDIIQQSIKNNRLHSNGGEYIFDYVSPNKHKKLIARRNTNHSRNLACNHLKTTIRTAYIKNLYESTAIYFQDILKSATKKGLNIEQLIGEHNISFTSKNLLGYGNYEKVIEKISLGIFRQLENEKSTKHLIEKMDKKLGLGIDKDIIDEALPFFELRHLLVHNKGMADEDFCSKYPQIRAEENKVVKITYQLIEDARQKVNKLVKEFDKKIIEKNLINEDEQQP